MAASLAPRRTALMASNEQRLLAHEGLPCDLVRDDLYKRVCEVRFWRLARQLGVTDDMLVEACVLLVVPIPDLAYWREKSDGAEPAPPRLPPYSGPQVYRTSSSTPESIQALINSPRCNTLLSVADVEFLTGRKGVGGQIEQLKIMQIPFATNGLGHPLVPVAAIEGRKKIAAERIKMIEEKKRPWGLTRP